MSDDSYTIIDCSDPDAPPVEVPMTPEQIAQRDADRAGVASGQASAAFESAEDVERLNLVAERSTTDPAFAALAELTLRGTP